MLFKLHKSTNRLSITRQLGNFHRPKQDFIQFVRWKSSEKHSKNLESTIFCRCSKSCHHRRKQNSGFRAKSHCSFRRRNENAIHLSVNLFFSFFCCHKSPLYTRLPTAEVTSVPAIVVNVDCTSDVSITIFWHSKENFRADILSPPEANCGVSPKAQP